MISVDEEELLINLMNEVSNDDHFNIHRLMRHLFNAIQKKHKGAIDLLVNTLYHYLDH